MKLKSIVVAICSVVCAGAVWTAVNNEVQYVSASETTVDISAGVSISGWQNSAELKMLTISFDKNVLEGIFDISTIVPAVGFILLALVLWFWYPLHKKQVNENVKYLEKKHKK